MTVREIHIQSAQHIETGAIVRSHGRGALQFELDGHVMTIPVEIGASGDHVYLPPSPHWDDGAPLDHETASLLKPIILEVERFWGMKPSFSDD